MKQVSSVFLLCLLATGCADLQSPESPEVWSTRGSMPNLARENSNTFHLVYGSGDSILYSHSNNGGTSFATPHLVSVLPKLAASHTRGPQIAVTANGLVLTACNGDGNIFSFIKNSTGNWEKTARVNDVDTVAKENFVAVSADNNNVFAVWLDLRDKHNKIFGAKSTDGGKSWLKNVLIYASPDSTVCECCKPSVVLRGNEVYVMFRNWLNGNRDLHLIKSIDGGQTFKQAQKLGTGTWALNGCPMDGGGMVLDKDGSPQTVWNRKGKIIAFEPGKEEQILGEGRSCTVESVNGKNAYAWVEKGMVVVASAQGTKQTLGKGQHAAIKAMDNDHIVCVWENDGQIKSTKLKL